MSRYDFAEPARGGCFWPDRPVGQRSLEILAQAADWYGATVQYPPRSGMRSTEVLRIDDVGVLQEQRAWVDYVRSLGVDPNRVRPALVIMQDDNGYHLHLSHKTPAYECGGDLLDLATNDVVSTPLVIDLGREKTWPEATVTERSTDFSEALVACRQGKRITRCAWHADQWVAYSPGFDIGPDQIFSHPVRETVKAEGGKGFFPPYLMMRDFDGGFCPWQPTASDVLAMDWVTVE